MIAEQFKSFAVNCLNENYDKISSAVELLNDEQVWQRPNDISNSIGNLLIHLRGNITQWILSGLAGEPDLRNRKQEFEQRDVVSPSNLLGELRQTLDRVCHVIEDVSPHQLEAEYSIQGYSVTGTAAIFHIVEHFSWHSGQIVYAMKAMTGKELRIYDENGHRLDGRTSRVP